MDSSAKFKFAKIQLSGFTLIEFLVVISIFAVLATLAVINLLKPQTQASVATTAVTLIADIRRQQLAAMAGDSGNTSTSQPQGIFFETNKYTLFVGSTYSAGAIDNFVINLDNNLTFSSITFPASTLVFSKRNGEVSGFVDASSSVTVRNTQSGEQVTISVNRYGAISVN